MPHFSGHQDVSAVSHSQGFHGLLLNHDNTALLGCQGPDMLTDIPGYLGSEPRGRFVQEQKIWLRHEHSPDS